MSYEICGKLRALTPYEPVGGTYRIRLDANESFLPIPEEIRREMAQAAASIHFNRYPDPLAADVCNAFGSFYGINPTFVTAGNGSDELISVIMGAFLERGSTVVSLAPDFSMYAFYAELAECKSVVLEKGDGFVIDVDAVIAGVRREKADLLIFSNPCNPTSVLLAKEEVRRLVRGVDALVVLDEAYMDFADGSLLQEAAEYENLIILRTCSKAFGLAAIRLGFAVANETLTRGLRSAKSPYNVNSLTQEIGRAVLSKPEAAHIAIEQIKNSRRDLYTGVCKLAEEYPQWVKPVKTDTNFVFSWFDGAQELFEWLKSHGIVVRCMGEHLRITAGRNYENEQTLVWIKAFYDERG